MPDHEREESHKSAPTRFRIALGIMTIVGVLFILAVYGLRSSGVGR